MGTIGVFLGLGGVWASLLISSLVGALVGVIIGRIQKNEQILKTAIPYGPFLVVGAFAELFFEVSKWMNI